MRRHVTVTYPYIDESWLEKETNIPMYPSEESSSSAKSVLKWPAPIRLGAKVIYTTQSQLQIQGYLTWLELKKIKMIVVFVLNVAILKHNYK